MAERGFLGIFGKKKKIVEEPQQVSSEPQVERKTLDYDGVQILTKPVDSTREIPIVNALRIDSIEDLDSDDLTLNNSVQVNETKQVEAPTPEINIETMVNETEPKVEEQIPIFNETPQNEVVQPGVPNLSQQQQQTTMQTGTPDLSEFMPQTPTETEDRPVLDQFGNNIDQYQNNQTGGMSR